MIVGAPPQSLARSNGGLGGESIGLGGLVSNSNQAGGAGDSAAGDPRAQEMAQVD